MSYDKKKLANYVSELLSNTTADFEKVDRDRPYSILGGAGSHVELTNQAGQTFVGKMSEEGTPTLYILEAGLRSLYAFVDECLKDREFATKIGSDALVKHLQATAKKFYAVSPSDLDLAKIVKEDILQALRAEIRQWRVHVPISNLQIQQPLTIGRVTFVRHEEGVVASTKIIIDHQGPPNADRSTSDKAALLVTIGAISQQGSAWAVAEIESHEKRVSEVAREEIETAVNVIRAFTHVFNSRSLHSAFGLPYELTNGTAGFISQSKDLFLIQMDRRGFFHPFDLNEIVVTKLKSEYYFDQLVRIAGTAWGSLNSLEKAVRVAFHWLGRSIIALTKAEAFTQCVIALERLLITDDEETTVERFADRLAYLLSDKSDERKAIHRAAKRLYDVRSRIVHAGFDSIEERQIQEIENLAVGGLVKAASLLDSLVDHNALRDYFHNCKMT